MLATWYCNLELSENCEGSESLSEPAIVSWMLVEDINSWVRNKGLCFSQHSKQHEVHVYGGCPGPSSFTKVFYVAQVDPVLKVGFSHR